MKRIFTFILMITFLAACETMHGPVEVPTDVVKSDGIGIAISQVKDNSAVIELNPKGEGAYFAYMVAQGDEPHQLDSALLYRLAYSDIAIKQESLEWGVLDGANSMSFTVEKLEPNTKYQVYAVAGSTTGVPSEISIESFTTSDKVAPEFVKSEFSETGVVVTFSESISKKEGDLVALYYAINSEEIQSGESVGEVAIPDDNVSVEGNTVTITLPEIPNGAFYTIDFPEGKFVDVCENESLPLVSTLIFPRGATGPETEGVWGFTEDKNFVIPELNIPVVTSLKEPVIIPMDETVTLAGFTSAAKITLTYTKGKRETSYNMVPGEDIDIHPMSSSAIFFFYPEDTDMGTQISLTISDGSIVDPYGNGNDEWTYNTIYSYGYTVEDVIGLYEVKFTSYFDHLNYITDLTIEESDDPEKGEVMITSVFGLPAQTPVYGSFDSDSGLLEFPKFSVLNGVSLSDGSIAVAALELAVEGELIVFNLVSAGELVTSNYWGISLYDPATSEFLGWSDVAISTQATRTGGVPTTSSSITNLTKLNRFSIKSKAKKIIRK